MAASVGKRVFVVGVGMCKFLKPKDLGHLDYPDLAKEALNKALKDARTEYSAVKAAAVGYVYGDSTCGQRVLYEVGMTGIPVYNVNNNCSTGSSALLLATELIRGGSVDCALALGFEKMARGSLGASFTDRAHPMERFIETLSEIQEITPDPMTAQLFGAAGEEHMRKYGSKVEHFEKIAIKNRKHSTKNPYSQMSQEVTSEEVRGAPQVYKFMTRLHCCPTSNGAAAAILANEDFVKKHKLESQAVEIVGSQMVTDTPSTFEEKSAIKLVGFDMTRKAAELLFGKTGLKPSNVDVVELHDCFSTNELLTYEALGLCPEGKGHVMVDKGDNTYGGKYVVNPSGGLMSKGHPLGATGLAQCTELCWQLRGEADQRQVPNAKLALQHNIGLGGAVVLFLYKKGFPQYAQAKL